MNTNRDNRIGDLMRERGLKPFPFSKEIGVKSSTMTSIYKGKVNFENIRIDTFLKIAKGLGMTAEELFYGDEHKMHKHVYSDPRQQEANEIWSHVNEQYRAQMWEHAKVIDMAYDKSTKRNSVQEIAV